MEGTTLIFLVPIHVSIDEVSRLLGPQLRGQDCQVNTCWSMAQRCIVFKDAPELTATPNSFNSLYDDGSLRVFGYAPHTEAPVAHVA